MKQVVTLVQDLLTFHPFGYALIQVIGYLLELDNLPQNAGSVVGCLEQTRNENRLKRPDYLSLRLPFDRGLLTALGAGTENLPPFEVRGIYVLTGGVQVC